MDRQNIVVIGGGLAGLMAAVRAAEQNFKVSLVSLVAVRRSHSVCAQGGINAAVNTKGEGDSPWEHFDDTIYGGDFLANQTPVKRMCDAAPGVIYLFNSWNVGADNVRISSASEPGLLGDLNGDGFVNMQDLFLLLTLWHTQIPTVAPGPSMAPVMTAP